MMVFLGVMFLLFLNSVKFLKNYLFIVIIMLINYLYLKFNCYNYMKFNLYYLFGLDLFSFFLIILSLWIMFILFNIMNSNKMLIMLNLFMLMSLIMVFCSLNLMIYYLFFEISLIPIMLIIMMWGNSPERFLSSMYMIIYTLIISLPMFMILIKLSNSVGSLNFDSYYIIQLESLGSVWFNIMLLIFMVKLPMFILHIWLPKAHVEAPVFGSMILAAILLKLGGFGIMRLMMMMIKMFNFYSNVYMVIGMLGSVYISMISIVQIDMKVLVAYSSIVHMNMMFLGLMLFNKISILGSYIIMIGHGLCSSLMFYMVNMFYERSMSRLMMLNKGMLLFMPKIMLWWYIVNMNNISAPPSLNLFGELMVFQGMLLSNLMFMIMALMVFFCSVYSFNLYMSISHGKFCLNYVKVSVGMLSENLIIISHLVPLNMMFLLLKMII